MFFQILLLLSCTDSVTPSTEDSNLGASDKRRLVVHISGIKEKPWSSNSSFDLQTHFNQLVFSHLLNIGSNLEISPGIIKKWSWSETESQYTLVIDDSLRYHDGSKLQIEDVEYALLRRYLRMFQDGDHLHDSNIVGIESLKRGAKFKSGMCEGINKIDSNTLSVKLKTSNPLFLYSLTESTIVVAPSNQFGGDHELKKNVLPIGTGPFKVAWSDPNTSLVRLKRVTSGVNENEISIIELHSEGVEPPLNADIIIGAPSKLADPGKYEFVNSSFPISILMMDFNYANPSSKKTAFRSAISLAIDRKSLSNDILNSKPLHELIPEGFFGRSGVEFQFNPDIGKERFKNNFESVRDKKFFGVYHGLNVAKKPQFIRTLEKQLLKIGLTVQFEPKKNVDFLNLDRKYLFSVYGFATSFVDPLFAFKQYINGPPSMKYNSVGNDKVAQALLSQAEQTNDKIRKSDILKNLSKHFQKENTTLPLLSIPLVLAYKKTDLEPIHPSKSFIFDLNTVRWRK